MPDNLKVSVNQLRGYCDPKIFKFKDTSEVEPLAGTIGQQRAVDALDFSLKVKTQGYNLFAAGPAGTGKETTIKSHVEKLAQPEEVPCDWAYVYNFKDADRPLAISLDAGKANDFAKDMDELIDGVKNEIPRAFEGEDYEKRKNRILASLQEQRDASLNKMQKMAEKQGFSIEITTAGIVTIPIHQGKPLKREDFDTLPSKQKADIQEKSEDLQLKINELFRKLRTNEKKARQEVKDLDKEITNFAIGHLLEELKQKYADNRKIIDYLDDIQRDIILNLKDFTAKQEGQIPGLEFLTKKPNFSKYKVNVLVDNSSQQGAPVVTEENPTYYNLMGKIEFRAELGAMSTGFNMIKPGAVHRANGGYLILRALDVLLNPFSYDALKRVLRNQEIKIENMGEQYRALPAATLKPESIDVNIKVILTGSPYIYQILFQLDEDFRKLFKVKADFNTEMDRTDEHSEKYAQFIASRVSTQNLKHFNPLGVAKVVEYGSQLASDQIKLSTRFADIADLVSEASYWASQNHNDTVKAEDVNKALSKKKFRSNMIEEKIQEYIKRDIFMIELAGEVVGQINSLSVLSVGDYTFGKPSKVTARISLGKKGVINVEREVKMGGPIYNKGVMILSGYLHGKYGYNKPLSLDASLTFEQEYGGVEGDSASSTELYAILSALADIPIKQSFAVTGSVNQQGEIQPIGGVNYKIEGFFDVCKHKGLTGEQGIIIPKQNVENLMLKQEVIDAVKDGRFQIYAIKTIDEGIEMLTGKKAGEQQEDGTYPVGTIHFLVDKKLRAFAERLAKYEKAA
ncbi:MAG: ATP-binding protein [Actinobacteria bacterium]|nr:MAG: ATP-binding protein [Actinomycetota bacterium]